MNTQDKKLKKCEVKETCYYCRNTDNRQGMIDAGQMCCSNCKREFYEEPLNKDIEKVVEEKIDEIADNFEGDRISFNAGKIRGILIEIYENGEKKRFDGISEWKNFGKKYGYLGYVLDGEKDRIKKEIAKQIIFKDENGIEWIEIISVNEVLNH